MPARSTTRQALCSLGSAAVVTHRRRRTAERALKNGEESHAFRECAMQCEECTLLFSYLRRGACTRIFRQGRPCAFRLGARARAGAGACLYRYIQCLYAIASNVCWRRIDTHSFIVMARKIFGKKAAPQRRFWHQGIWPRSEEDEGQHRKQRHEDAEAPRHVAEEAGHLHATVFGNRLDHEVGRIADVGVGAHEHGAR